MLQSAVGHVLADVVLKLQTIETHQVCRSLRAGSPMPCYRSISQSRLAIACCHVHGLFIFHLQQWLCKAQKITGLHAIAWSSPHSRAR